MIDHTGLLVSDLERSRRFYAAALAPLGYCVRLEQPQAVGFGGAVLQPGDDPGGDFWLAQGTPYVPRNHLAFRARDPAAVAAFHAAALAAGGTDNGPPGPRAGAGDYYGAFVLDPDGNNIEACCRGAAATEG